MTIPSETVHVAVIGAGLAGVACARGLRQAGAQVALFEKTSQVGGRMTMRRATTTEERGALESATVVDHGAQCFAPVRPRFRSLMADAIAAGAAREWQPRVHSSRHAQVAPCLVPTPRNSALCAHLLADTPVLVDRPVRRLQRAVDGAWHVATEGAPLAGPFQHVALAIPPAQAALLVAGHKDAWADALMAKRMEPRWTLIAVTDDLDLPWDAAEPDRGPLAWVLRNDRVPGRPSPRGMAVWTAQATAQWSAAHLESDPQAVRGELQSALRSQLPCAIDGQRPVHWHYVDVHRWRNAGPAFDCDDSFDRDEMWWDASLGLGVCGDFLGGGGVEGAWHSGDELADAMAASFESHTEASDAAWALT